MDTNLIMLCAAMTSMSALSQKALNQGEKLASALHFLLEILGSFRNIVYLCNRNPYGVQGHIAQ